ncbi:MAG: hypothetical protein LQ351_005886 [Letrouitia transgressa]|nr:MAG: hypothetical protein LQ351_005886 [Letrouitia transgressa]
MAAATSGSQDVLQDEQKPPTIIYSSDRAPWTAARCNRLLRPLSSKINLLRKAKRLGLKEDDLVKGIHGSSSTLKKSSREPPTRKTHRIGSEASDSADEEWAPNPRPSKKVRRTYSSRSGGNHRQIPAETTEVKGLRRPKRAMKEISIPKDYITTRPESSPSEKTAEVVQATHSQDTDQSQPEEQNQQTRLQATIGSTHAATRSFFTKKWSSQWKLAEGISNGLQTILAATEGNRSMYRRGARSLFCTCLRKVPPYIAEEERWYKADEPEGDLDISSTVYDHLESLCADPSAGWRPLRQVVRAHGVAMICDAIKDSLLTFSLVRQLTAICIQQAAWDEAQHFIESLIALLDPDQKHNRQADLTSMLFGIMDEFIRFSGRVWFRYQQITLMLKLGKLPVDWIARYDMIDCWNTAVCSVTREDDHSKEAGELLRLVVAMGYGGHNQVPGRKIHGLRLESGGYSNMDENNDSDQSDSSDSSPEENSYGSLPNVEHHADGNKSSATASSLLTVLCAIGLLRSTASVSSPSDLQASNSTVLEYMAADAYQFLELSQHATGIDNSLQKNWTVHPLLANGLVRATACQSWQELDQEKCSFFEEMGQIGNITELSDKGAPFLCAVAECCARASYEETFDHMQKLVKHVSSIANTLGDLSPGRELCDQICVAAAFEYAEGSKQPKHLHWALDVEQTISGASAESTRRTPHKTPTRGLAQTKTGYRWEAGICEWVAKTPGVELLHPETRELRHDVGRQRRSNRPPPQKRPSVAPPTAELACPYESPVCGTKVPEEARKDENAALRAGRGHVRCMLRSSQVVGKKDQGGRKLLFSHIHIHIEDREDELSNQDMSHRRGRRHGQGLREVNNIGLTLPRGKCGPQGRQRAGPVQRSRTTGWGNGARVEMKTEILDSEDELSFL